MATVVSAAALVTGLLIQASGAPPPLILQITYADGRTVPHTVAPSARSSWTPMFPRIAGWQPENGALAPTAIDYHWTREAEGVRVRVSLRFGQPHREDRVVATVVVGRDARVRVEELRQFGVEAVELSLAEQQPDSIAAPAVVGRTTGLEVVSIEPMLDPIPRYRVTVRNVRDVGVLSFRHEWFAGERLALSGRQGERSGEPIVEPRGTFTFDVSVPQRRQTPEAAWQLHSMDAFAVTSILWTDWTVEGGTESAGQALVLQLGRRVQLRRVVQIYRELLQAGAADAEVSRRALIDRIEALPRVADGALVATARSLHPATESLSIAAIEGTLAAGLQDVQKHLRPALSVDQAHRALDAATLAGLLRDGLTAAETWLATVTAALPR